MTLRILVIGGGKFLGRAFVAQALADGHEVTVFNRGRSGADQPGVRAVRGDRGEAADLARLAGQGPWDAVVDTCGYIPKVVGEGARALAGKADAYLFISSLSALSDWPATRATAASSVFACEPDAVEGEYGPLKAGCERAVRAHFPGRVLNFRAGVIIGPHEEVGRQPWWLTRIARGGEVLAPGDPQREIRLIDARDIARFGLRCLVDGREGDFAVAGTPGYATFGRWLEACVRETGSDARLVWADDAVLLEHKVDPWTGLPLWTPVDEEAAAVWDYDTSAEEALGLVCRPIEESVRDTWAWIRDSPDDLSVDEEGRVNGHGIPAELERAVLAAVAAS